MITTTHEATAATCPRCGNAEYNQHTGQQIIIKDSCGRIMSQSPIWHCWFCGSAFYTLILRSRTA